jgi:hypothetical protein
MRDTVCTIFTIDMPTERWSADLERSNWAPLRGNLKVSTLDYVRYDLSRKRLIFNCCQEGGSREAMQQRCRPWGSMVTSRDSPEDRTLRKLSRIKERTASDVRERLPDRKSHVLLLSPVPLHRG